MQQDDYNIHRNQNSNEYNYGINNKWGMDPTVGLPMDTKSLVVIQYTHILYIYIYI